MRKRFRWWLLSHPLPSPRSLFSGRGWRGKGEREREREREIIRGKERGGKGRKGESNSAITVFIIHISTSCCQLSIKSVNHCIALLLIFLFLSIPSLHCKTHRTPRWKSNDYSKIAIHMNDINQRWTPMNT